MASAGEWEYQVKGSKPIPKTKSCMFSLKVDADP